MVFLSKPKELTSFPKARAAQKRRCDAEGLGPVCGMFFYRPDTVDSSTMVIARILCCLLALIGLLSATDYSLRAAEHQIKIVNAAFKAPSVDLLPVLSLVKSSTRTAAIELPNGTLGNKQLMSLQASGAGNEHSWVVFSIKNPELKEQNLVLTIDYRGFVGSAVLWPWSEGSQIVGLQASQDQTAERLDIADADAFTLSVAAGGSATYAIELNSEGISGVRLWRQTAFNSQSRQLAFFRGVVLGIAMLFAIGFACLFIIRPLPIFPAASLFGWSSVLFIVTSSGQSPALLEPLLEAVTQTGLRAWIEGAMLFSLALMVAALLELHRRSRWLFALFALIAAAALGVSGYSLVEPAMALGIIRMTFAGTVVVTFICVLLFWQRGVQRARAALLPIVMLVAWTALAALACLGLLPSIYLLPALSAGLVMVVVTLGFSLAQVAFGNAVGSHYFMRDSGRRALALAGSQLSVWDWQIDEGQLYVGPELERALGFQLGSAGTSDLEDWLELIHPADRSAYFAAIEDAERRGRGTFSQEFRLRRADGAYRWYKLRARAVANREGPTRMIGTLADVSARKRAEENILIDAVYDRITGLPNKALFLDRLANEMRRAQTNPENVLYVLIVDLDRFRVIDDRLGHEIGDSLLDVTARRISHLLSPHDTLARLPADQFGVILSGDDHGADIVAFCEKLRDALAVPVHLRAREVFITASIGVAAYADPHQAATGLLEDAEIALHEAKRHGKHMVEFFSPRMRSQPSAFTLMKAELRQAIERGGISVLYQPVKRLSDGQLAGFEALARLEHPVSGTREAESFIALAEQTGMVKEVGRYVLAEAARQLGIWQRAFRPSDPLFVTVNVSSHQLIDNDIVADIKAVLTREGIQPGTLMLELTETALMQNLEMAVMVLDRIKALGVGLACDDFGSGYSGFSNLRRLPFELLKIDKDFLPADDEDEKSAIIIESIILMAHDLQQQVVVEGVENEDQIEQLKAFGCDFAQGFYVGRPVTAQRIIEALGSMPYGSQSDGAKDIAFWQLLTSPDETSAHPPAAYAVPVRPQEEPVIQTLQPALLQRNENVVGEGPAQFVQSQPIEPEDVTDPDSIWPEDEAATTDTAADDTASAGDEVAPQEGNTLEEAEVADEKAAVPVVAAVNDNAPSKEPDTEAIADEDNTSPAEESGTSPSEQSDEADAASDKAAAGEAEHREKLSDGEDGREIGEKEQDGASHTDADVQDSEGDGSASIKPKNDTKPSKEVPTIKDNESQAKQRKTPRKTAVKRTAKKTVKRAAKKTTTARKGPLAKKLRRAAKTRTVKRKP